MNKQGLTCCSQPEEYGIFDERISKPICLKQFLFKPYNANHIIINI